MSAELTEELRESDEYDVIGSGMTIHDIPDITVNLQKDKFFKAFRGEKPDLISRFWSGSKEFTTWRENILRLAAYRYFKDQIAAGAVPYGASKREVVDATTDPHKKAALLARELLGDYGNLTSAGQYIRRRMIPFYSWMEINAPRYVRMMRNLPIEGRGTAKPLALTSAVLAKKGAVFTVKASMLYGAVQIWNHIFWPEEEEELGSQGRRQGHIIIGRRDDGTIMTLRFEGALADALSWFGAEDAPQDIKNLANGKKTFFEWLGEGGMSAANRFVQGFRPDIKLGAELISGKTYWPEFWNSRPIRDRAEHITRMFALDMPYRRLVGKPLRGNTVHERIFADLMNLAVGITDPKEATYYEARSLAREYLESLPKNLGIQTPTIEPTDRGNALYNYKKALKFGDIKAAEKYLKAYGALGGTYKGLNISIKKAHPLAGVPVRHRQGFVKSLDKGERDKLKKAIQWYETTYLRRGNK